MALRVALAAICLVLAACGPAISSPLSIQQFRDAGAARIRAAEPTAQISVRDEQGLSVTIPNDPVRHDVQVNYQRAYDLYRADPTRLDALLDQWAHNALVETLEALTRERLVVVLRGRRLVTSYDGLLRRDSQTTHLLARPYVGDLFVVLAFDTPNAIAYATNEKVAELGLSEDEAWQLATANLEQRMGDLRVAPSNLIEGASYVEADSGLAPSFILNSEVCRSGAVGALVWVGSRDGYFFTMAQDAAGQLQFRHFVNTAIARGEAESETMLTCRDGHIEAE